MTTTPRFVRMDAKDFRGEGGQERFVARLNERSQDVARTLGRLGEGRQARLIELVVDTPAGGVEGAFPVYFQHGLDFRPHGLSVVAASVAGHEGYVFASALMPTWDVMPDGLTLAVRHISGLEAGLRYRLRIRVDP